MRLKYLFFVILFVLQAASLWAQNFTVTGTVKDSEGETLTGVSIVVKGSDRYAMSDGSGNYTIQAQSQDVLIFSYLGFEKQELQVVGNKLNVVMQPDNLSLDEVIVVAYRTTSKDSYTGAASLLKKESIEKSQVSSVSRALQGEVSGVQSVASSGQPGTNAAIYIRGVGSINASSNPLYVVDGAPFDGDINSINPSDIEAISVLKDAASSALYGSRGANGVIIITTKQGKRDQKPRVDLKLTYGKSSRAIDDYEHVTTDQYFKMFWEGIRNQEYYGGEKKPMEDAAQIATDRIVGNLGINPYGTKYPKPVDTNGNIVAGAYPLWDDNWSKNYDQDAHRFESIVNISGGGKTSDYYVSLGYLNDQGIGIGSGFERFNGRVKLNTEVKPWFNLSANIGLTHSVQDYPASEDSSLGNAMNFARLMPSFYPIWQRDRTDGSFLLDANGNRMYDYGAYRPSAASPKYNHLGSTPYDINQQNRDIASIRLAAGFNIYKGLKFKSTFNLDYTNRNDTYYVNPEYGAGIDYGGGINRDNYKTTGLTVNNIFTYDFKINTKHDFKLLAGHEYYEFNTENISGSRENFILPGLYEPDAASLLKDFTGKSDNYKLLSFLGNFEYSYDNRYYGSASLRTDGSSRFSPESRWGTFWSLGASWRAINESFAKEINWLSNLTLRASYGGQGNDNLGTYYAYKALYAIQNNLGESGVVTDRLPTPELKWETNLNLNIGLDLGFFGNRLTSTIELFDRRSKDLLFERPMPLSIGYGAISANVGAMKNVGYEFSIKGMPVQTKDWQWDISVNGTHFKNTITDLPQSEIIRGNQHLVKGGSIYDFYLVEWAGIDPKDGMPQWYKTTTDGSRVVTKVYSEASTPKKGEPASKITAGTSLPDLVGGFSSNLTYKDFDFSVLFAYSLGGKIYNADKLSIMHTGNLAGRAFSTEMLNHWTPENPNADVPRLQTANTNWTSASTRFLVDASYMRMKNISFGYNLPKPLLQKMQISNCKVYVAAENLLTFYDQQGLDPEQTVGGTTYFRYPAMKTVSLGFNLSF